MVDCSEASETVNCADVGAAGVVKSRTDGSVTAEAC